MKRRAFLAALGAGTVGLAGCSGRRTVESVTTDDVTLRPGEFHHRRLDLTGRDAQQFNLKYTVTADGLFDVYLFGGQADPAEFEVYRRATERNPTVDLEPSEWHTVTAARDTAEVNKPLTAGVHHFVVDNTPVGPAEPAGPLEFSYDLAVRNFDVLPDDLGG